MMDSFLKINKKTAVNKKEIIFLEAVSNYTCIHTIEKQVVSSVTMKKVMNRIGSMKYLKINRGLLVNKSFILKADLESENPFILMINAKKLPISRRRLQHVIESLNLFTVMK